MTCLKDSGTPGIWNKNNDYEVRKINKKIIIRN